MVVQACSPMFQTRSYSIKTTSSSNEANHRKRLLTRSFKRKLRVYATLAVDLPGFLTVQLFLLSVKDLLPLNSKTHLRVSKVAAFNLRARLKTRTRTSVKRLKVTAQIHF